MPSAVELPVRSANKTRSKTLVEASLARIPNSNQPSPVDSAHLVRFLFLSTFFEAYRAI